MRRIAAYLADQLILFFVVSGVSVYAANLGLTDLDTLITAALAAGVLAWAAYYFIADYFFGGMTLGKKLCGARMVWYREDQGLRLREALQHISFKGLLTICWPIGLAWYRVHGCRAPYDRRLGIVYLADEDPRPRGQRIAGIVIMAAAFVMVIVGGFHFLLQGIGNADYYFANKERIASVSTVLGPQRLTGYSASAGSDSGKIVYQYRLPDEGTESIERYVDYLIREEGFQRDSQAEAEYRGKVSVIRKTSSDGAYEIKVSVADISGRLLIQLEYEQS